MYGNSLLACVILPPFVVHTFTYLRYLHAPKVHLPLVGWLYSLVASAPCLSHGYTIQYTWNVRSAVPRSPRTGRSCVDAPPPPDSRASETVEYRAVALFTDGVLLLVCDDVSSLCQQPRTVDRVERGGWCEEPSELKSWNKVFGAFSIRAGRAIPPISILQFLHDSTYNTGCSTRRRSSSCISHMHIRRSCTCCPPLAAAALVALGFASTTTLADAPHLRLRNCASPPLRAWAHISEQTCCEQSCCEQACCEQTDVPWCPPAAAIPHIACCPRSCYGPATVLLPMMFA